MGRSASTDTLRLAVALLPGGCVSYLDEDPPPAPTDIVYEGETIRIGVEDGVQACGASFEYMEKFVELYLASSADGDLQRPVEYYFVTPDTLRSDLCQVSAACARGGFAYATSPVNTHELVHAIRQLQVDRPAHGSSLFEEGFAQWHYPIDVGWDDAFSIARLPDDVTFKMPRKWYDPAAQAISVAVAEHDLMAVEALVGRSSEAPTSPELDALVDDVLGVDLDGLAAAIDATPACSAFARARLLVECAAEPAQWHEAPWSSAPFMIDAVPMRCDSPRVIGPLAGRLWIYATIDVPQDGRYDLDVESEDGQRLELSSCAARCGAQPEIRWDDAMRQEEIQLRKGRIVIRLGRELGDERPASFQLRGPLP